MGCAEMTPTPEMIALAEDIANKKCLHFGNADWWRVRDAALTVIMEVSEKAARIAESAFDDRRYLRSYHHSEMDWTYGYGDATRAVAASIRNGEHLRCQ